MAVTGLVALTVALACQVARAQDLAVMGARVYVSPQAEAVRESVLIRGGKIAAVGARVFIPEGMPRIECPECVVFAGFWNCHVHFMEPKWDDAAHLPAARLTEQMQAMLTHSGFATVVDVGSDLSNTAALRRRVEAGGVAGPKIYTAGLPLFPEHGLPYYLKDLPEALKAKLGQPASPAEAAAFVERNVAGGSDVVKLFTGSYVTEGQVKPMRPDIAHAAAVAGHRHGQLVFAHPSNLEGVRVAVESGVDVLAHAPDQTEGVDEALLKEMVARHMAMVPTLKLFSHDGPIARIREVVKQFHGLGGELLFGTDTGFLTDYDMTEEYRQLSAAGLTWREVAAMLTTAPAERFRVSNREGRVAAGMHGDLTILGSDPADGDMTAFARVRYTVRAGQVIFAEK